MVAIKKPLKSQVKVILKVFFARLEDYSHSTYTLIYLLVFIEI